MNKKVDYIFPYVNSLDPNWQKMARKYFTDKKWASQRFRELGFLKYVFRGLAKNMPWLNKIVFIISSKSQIPAWLDVNNDKIRIVTHDEFIPKKYLPTFNSNTIEMFLANIPGLSEYLIYGNDDLIPISKSEISDYFTETGLPKISYRLRDTMKTAFQIQCKRNWSVVAKYFPDIKLKKNEFYSQLHCSQAITLNILQEASELLEKERLDSITRKRDFKIKNLSQCIYFNYAIASGKCKMKSCDYVFKYITKKKLKSIIDEIKAGNNKWICLNDSVKTELDVIKFIISALEQKFPDKCIYEK